MEDLISVIVASASGGLFGFLGSVVGAAMKLLGKKQEADNQEKLWAHEERLLAIEIDREGRKAEYEMELIREQGANQLLITGIEAGANLEGTSKWVKNVVSLVRPFMTAALWIIAYMMFLDLRSMTIYEPMLVKLTSIAFFSASSTTAYWFSDRTITKRVHEMF